jgi:plastocyanin
MQMKHLASLTGLAMAAAGTAGAVRLSGSAPADAITGTVTYTGTLPKMKPIDMAKEPSCASKHPTPALTESVETGPGNALENVVVYVSAGGQPSAAPTSVVRYDQKGCQYIPHVAVVQVDQPMEITNEDQTSHNIHPLATTNPEWNKSQPPGAPAIKASFAKPEFIHVKCNVHPWMHGYFAVLNTPHHATTGEHGTYSLQGLAPGKYTVTAWHERYGSQSEEVTVGSGETPKVNFVFKALPY